MHLKPVKLKPLPLIAPRKLPGLKRRADDEAGVGQDTGAFRAVLRRPVTGVMQKVTTAETMPLAASDGRLEAHLAELARQKRRRQTRRRVASIVVALLLLLGVGGPILSADMGVQAFNLGIGQSSAPVRPNLAASNSGMMELNLPAAQSTTGVPSKPGLNAPTPTPSPTPRPVSVPPSGDYSSWTPPPGYSSFAVTEPSPDPYGSFGQCTWWAAYQRPDENFSGFGDAWNWANSARSRGYTVSATPAAGATMVFAAGVQGASSAGHVAHVEQVLSGGWVLVSEMNFYWNGGGWGRVDYRYAYAGDGVWFIY